MSIFLRCVNENQAFAVTMCFILKLKRRVLPSLWMWTSKEKCDRKMWGRGYR